MDVAPSLHKPTHEYFELVHVRGHSAPVIRRLFPIAEMKLMKQPHLLSLDVANATNELDRTFRFPLLNHDNEHWMTYEVVFTQPPNRLELSFHVRVIAPIFHMWCLDRELPMKLDELDDVEERLKEVI